MDSLHIHARHYASGQRVDVACAQGKIENVYLSEEKHGDDLWVAPALFDIQINGCHGISFSSPALTRDGVRHVANCCRNHGISEFCPTVITNSGDALVQCLTTLRGACEQDRTISAAIPGFHLEGPYLSPEDGPRGAHPRQHIRPPNWDEFCRLQEAAGGRIRLLTLAPELEGALPFIEKVVATGLVIALGHTAARTDQIRDAVAAGARLSTHLGNGAHALLPRHPNYIWDQLAEDRLWASIICDGHHLPPSVVRSIIRVKTPARTILSCDAGSLAASPPGRYREWEQDLEVRPEGKIVVANTDYLAGSWAFTDLCIQNAIRQADISLEAAVDMAGARPRELLALPPRRLQPGDPADLILFRWDEATFDVVATVIAGVSYARRLVDVAKIG